MSRETLLRDDDGSVYSLDNLATQKWLEGHYAGLDECKGWLEEKAIKLFQERRREEANAMQALADEMNSDLRLTMIKRAEEHERKFPSQIQAETF